MAFIIPALFAPLPQLLEANKLNYPPARVEDTAYFAFQVQNLFTRSDNGDFTIGLLLPLLTLISIPFIRRDSERWFWLIVAVGCFILALGPYVEIGGTRIDLPYALLHRLLGNQYRTPMRFMTPAVLALDDGGLSHARSNGIPVEVVDQSDECAARPGGRTDVVVHLGLRSAQAVSDHDHARLSSLSIDRAGARRFYGARTADRGAHRFRRGGAWRDAAILRAVSSTSHAPPVIFRACPTKCWTIFYADPLLGALTLSHGLPPQAEVDAQLSQLIQDWKIGYVVLHRDLLEQGRIKSFGDLLNRQPLLEKVGEEGPLVIYKASRRVARCTDASVTRNRWEWPIVIGLLLIAFFFRVWMLNDVPPGLHHDEVIIGQVAKDILRGHLGIYFTAGYGHEPLYHYLVAGMFGAIGANAFVLRLTSAFIAMLGLAATYTFRAASSFRPWWQSARWRGCRSRCGLSSSRALACAGLRCRCSPH